MHLLHVFPSFEVGGAQLRTTRLIQGLGSDFRHSVLPLDGCRDAERFLGPEAAVSFLDAPPRRPSPQATWAHRGLMRRVRPDLVCTYNWGSIDAALATRLCPGLPLVHHEDGFGRDELAAPLPRRSVYRRLVLGGARAVIVPSSRLEQVARENWRLPARLVHRVPNGVDLGRYTVADGRPELRARHGIPAGAPLVGSVGGLRPEKNAGRLIDVHAALPPALGAWLMLVGDGVERSELEQRARDRGAGERVVFVGLVDDPVPYYRALDVFALTSDTEQMPLALVEAMACGLPAIASDVGDTRSVLPPEQQELVVGLDAGDAVRRLAEGLADLLGEPGRRAALGRANRTRVEAQFDLERMLDRYRQLYLGAAGRPTAGGMTPSAGLD